LKKTLLILITGACGFIGKNLVEGLLKKKNLIIGTYYIKKNFIKSLKVKYIKINSSNFSDFNKITSKPNVLVHLSNKILNSRMQKSRKKFDFNKNFLSMINVLNFCKEREVEKLIYISSSTGYPRLRCKLKEINYFSKNPSVKSYLIGCVSRLLEKIIFIHKKLYNLKTKIIILRPSAIYGKYDNLDDKSSRLIPYIIKKVISNKFSIKIPGSGALVRNWVNVSEFTNLIIKLIFLKKNKDINIINISSDKNYSTLDLTKKVVKIAKKNIKIIKTLSFEKKLDHRILDNNKMKKLHLTVDNWTIDYHLKKTFEWYKKKK